MKKCSVEGCERQACSLSLCRKHYDASRTKDSHYREKHRERKTRRRLLQKGVRVEKVYRRVVWERDKGRCGLCGEMVDWDVKYPDPRSPSIDHIVPISKGGVHSYDNVQITHLRCNVGKGNREIKPVVYRGARIIWIGNKKHKVSKTD